MMEEAYAVAHRLCKQPPLALRAMRRVLNQTASTSLFNAIQLERETTISGFLDPETTKLLKNS